MKRLRKKTHLLIPAFASFLLLIVPFITYAEMSFAQNMVFGLVATVTGWVLGLGGLILDWGINDFLIGFGSMYNESGVGVAVDDMWSIIRDFVNMAFIFGLVYIGFKLILDSNDSQTKRWLARLIIAALLINFSLFFTKAVIEISNQFAIAILETGFPMEDGEVAMAEGIQNRLGITSTFGIAASNNPGVTEDNGWGYIFGVGITMLITGFVYAAGGILLIIRFAILNFYMVLSPVLFLGWILPPLAGTLDKYWNEFLKKAFVAPIYILMLYFSVKILDGFKDGNRVGDPNFSSTFLASSGNVVQAAESTIPYFILTCFFLIGSLKIAERMGAEGATKAISAGKSLQKFGMRQVGGVGARGVGRAAAATERGYKRFDAYTNQKQGVSGAAMRGTRRLLAVGSMGALSDKSIRSGLSSAKGASVFGSETHEQAQKRQKERRKENNQTTKDAENRAKYKDAKKTAASGGAEGNYRDSNGVLLPPLAQLSMSIQELGKSVRDMTDEERADLGFDELKSERVAMHLTDKHIESLEKSGDYSHAQIQEIKGARKAAQIAIAEGNYGDGSQLSGLDKQKFDHEMRENLVNKSAQEVGKLDEQIFKANGMASYITPQMLEQRMRNGLKGNDLKEVADNLQNLINSNQMSANQLNSYKKWVDGNSVYGAQVQLNFPRNPNPPQNPSPTGNQNPPQGGGPGIITPGSPGWNQANNNPGPRPGPQP